MKKFLFSLFLLILSTISVRAETAFYEDFTFYGELMTEIGLNKSFRSQKIQMIMPSFLNKRIPVILSGKAEFVKNDGEKAFIVMNFDKLSIDAKKSIPVKISVTKVNGYPINNSSFPDKNRYVSGLNKSVKYSKEFAFFPINRFNAIPKVSKPSLNNYVMLTEPLYACGGLCLFVASPVTALIPASFGFCDIPVGSILEFQFDEEISKEQLNQIIDEEYF